LKDADSDFPEPGSNPEHSTGRPRSTAKKGQSRVA
jgi:hypothetical protein